MDAASTPETAPAPKSWRTKLIALLLSVSVGGFFAEIAARMRYGTPLPERLPISRVQANAMRGWEMIPDEDHYTYQHLAEVNSLGLRGEELPEVLANGERRVLALGDSMVYGQGVATTSTIPAHLQQILQDQEGDDTATTWRVINAGHRAYATNQELGLLEELGSRIAPEIVILFWYDNDFEEYDIPATFAELSASGPRTFDVGAKLEGGTLLKWRFKQVVRRSALAMILHDRLRDRLEAPKDESFFEEGFTRLESHLTRFIDLCRELDARPVLAVIPVSATLTGDTVHATRAQRVQESARRQEVQVIDLLPGLRSLRKDLGVTPTLPYDGHYQGVANRNMAETLARELLK